MPRASDARPHGMDIRHHRCRMSVIWPDTEPGRDAWILRRNAMSRSLSSWEELIIMKVSLPTHAAAATLLATAFVLNMPARAQSNDMIQRVADQGTQADPGKTGVGSPGSKVGPSTGNTPSATGAGSQEGSAHRGSKVGASDNPAEPINPQHPSPNNQAGSTAGSRR
jgi:hypothetical protein